MIKLSYAVALPDCRSKRMQSYRGDLDAICGELQALGYEGVELFVRNPRALNQAAIAATLQAHGLAMHVQLAKDRPFVIEESAIRGVPPDRPDCLPS